MYNSQLNVRFAAWGYVGHGISPNVKHWAKDAKSGGDRNGTGTNIIVSRSHAGDVQKVVEASLGKDAKVEPAGGAGTVYIAAVS